MISKYITLLNQQFRHYNGRQLSNWSHLLVLVVSTGLVSCKTSEPKFSIYVPPTSAATKASLVSILATTSTTATVVIKSSTGLANSDWQLTAQTSQGTPFALTASDIKPLVNFTLTTFQAVGLIVGQTYRFRLHFVYNGRDTLRVERTYRHALPTYWRQLAHLDTDEGDFTGSLLISQQSGESFVSAVRYITDEQWQAWLYDRAQNRWLTSSVPDQVTAYVPRHGLVRFALHNGASTVYVFNGLGFLYNGLNQNQRIYKKTQFVKDNQGVKQINYAGGDGEIAFFTTADRAFLLTQLGAPTLWVRRGNWEQYQGHDFPEAPGTMATFVLDGTGYVVNQIDGKPPHLFAYNPDTDQWSRRADFPGPVRSRGVGFSAGGLGYFGLGITGDDQQGLRDLWQYDPLMDHWQYSTDYPGQGHRYVLAYSTDQRAYLGWGYESQPSAPGGARQVGCTDFWEFKP